MTVTPSATPAQGLGWPVLGGDRTAPSSRRPAGRTWLAGLAGRGPSPVLAPGTYPPDMPVVATKLHLPEPRPDLVARSRLQQLLATAESTSVRLVLVSAPAGFGKTT